MDVLFSEKALEQYIYWQNQDRKTLNRINDLLKDINRNGVDKGIGKPERLKYQFSSCWSRRIDDKNRLVYKIDDNGNLRVEICKGHY